MRRKDWIYLAFLVLAVAILIGVQTLQPQPIDWSESFEGDDDRPYGARVLFDLLPGVFSEGDVAPVWVAPYVLLSERAGAAEANYVFVTSLFAPDDAEADALLEFAERGGAVFVAAYSFGGRLADTLHVRTDFVSDLAFLEDATPVDLEENAEDSLHVRFVSPTLRRDAAFRFEDNVRNAYFAELDTAQAAVLGTNDDGQANLVRYNVGEGAVYLSTLPQVFTNYHVLTLDGADYAFAALSYLPDRDVLWDEHYKPLRAEVSTPLRFVLSRSSLRWAYGVGMVSLLLFVAFEARRRQRIIPVIEPLRNATLDFVQTVGRLYYQHRDHHGLARKKITYLLDYVRTRLRLPTAERDDVFVQRVSERSGVPLEDVQALFAFAERVERQPALTTAELERLSELVERFYRQSQR